jgi:hypothetical protein
MATPQTGDPVAALNARSIAMHWGMRCDDTLDFVRPELKALSALWHEKARETGWPSRADFDARSLLPFLPHVSIVERVTGEDGARRYRYRLIGTALVRLFGEATGRFLDESIPAQFLERWTLGYDTVLALRTPVRFLSKFELPQVSWLDGESFSVPLSNGAEPPNMILGALYVTPKKTKAAG